MEKSNCTSLTSCQSGRYAFTLMELLVVISIIALLIAMLMPSLGGARWEAIRSKCATQMRQIALSADAYSIDNKDRVIHARSHSVQIAIDPTEQVQFAKYGFPIAHWACPGRDYVPQLEAGFGSQMVIGYQYFGGIYTWKNQAGSFPGKSPVLRSQAGPEWVIAADTSIKANGVWGGDRGTAFGGMPSHRRNRAYPPGGNHTFMDGSTNWVPFEKMYMLHSWAPGARNCFFYQSDIPDGMSWGSLVSALDHMD